MFRFIFCAVVALSTVAYGRQEPREPVAVERWYDITTAYVNSRIATSYVFSNAAEVYKDPVIQSNVGVAFRCGLSANIFTSFPANLNDIGENFGTEVYPTVSFSKDIAKFNVTLTVGIDDLSPAYSLGDLDLLITSVTVARPLQVTPDLSITPYVYVENNLSFDGSEWDTFIHGGARWSWKINDRLTINGRSRLVYDPGFFGADVAYVLNNEAAVRWTLFKDEDKGFEAYLDLPGIRRYDVLNDVSDGRGDGWVAWFEFGVNF